MLNKKLKNSSTTKLSEVTDNLDKNPEKIEKTGFIKKTKKTSLFKTKSFRLREADLINFTNIVSHVNGQEERMEYSDSQVIRGIINYISDNADGNIKKLMPYIRTSS